MVSVVFEVIFYEWTKDEYLKQAANLNQFLKTQLGFISSKRYVDPMDESRLVSISYWEDEVSVSAWRNHLEHRLSQKIGREKLFKDYTITVSNVIRSYGLHDDKQRPKDSFM